MRTRTTTVKNRRARRRASTLALSLAALAPALSADAGETAREALVADPFPKLWAGSDPRIIRQRLDSTAAMLAALKEARAPELATLQARLKTLQDLLAGEAEPASEPELHVVACYRSRTRSRTQVEQTVEVRVTRVGAPVDLYLSAVKPVHWVIEAAPGVALRRVYIAGRHSPQTFEGVAERRVYGGMARERFLNGLRKRDNENLPCFDYTVEAAFAAAISAKTRLSPSSVRIVHTLAEATVGPDSEEWRLSRRHAAIGDLFSQVAGRFLAAHRETLRGLEASLLKSFPEIKNQRLSWAFPKRRFARAWAQGLEVPDFGDPNPRNPMGNDLILDASGTAYVLTQEALFRWDPKGAARRLVGKPALKKLEASWLNALALDSKRGRLIIASLHVNQRLYAYDLKSGGLSELPRGELQGQDFGVGAAALAYDAKRDQLYGFGQLRHDGLAIVPIESDGRRGKPVVLEASRASWSKRFAGLLPKELPFETLEAGMMLRVHDGKVLAGLRIPLSRDLFTNHARARTWLHVLYAYDLDAKTPLGVGIEVETR